MSNPKRQHYIPRMLLQQFADDRGKLFFFNKKLPDKGVLQSTPRKLFVENRLYDFTDFDGKRNISTETSLADTEAKVSPIIKKILDSARLWKFPKLTPVEKDTWVLFFTQLLMRLPSTRDRTASDEAKSVRYQQAFRRFRRMPATEPVDKMEMESLIRNELWSRSISNPGELVEEVALPTLRSMSFGVALTQREQSAFVIGSNPILRIRSSFDLDHPDIQLWLPLANDVAVFSFHGEQEILGCLDDKDVQNFNRDVFEQSTKVAGRSLEQIESVAAIVSNS